MTEFPHMLPGQEIELWRTFLRLFRDQFDEFDYDVRLGQGAKPHRKLTPEIERDLKMLTQKRVDAVGWKGDQPHIIEVKPFAGLAAVGQLIGYRELWIDEKKSPLVPEIILVTNQISRDTQRVCERKGVEVYVI